jgi:pyruvate dehydrogenase E2 component (dihydrolipoamide acetyltransferase)
MIDMKDNCISFDIRRKVVAASTSLGWTAPHVSYVYEADVTGLIIEFKKINDSKSDNVRISLNTVLTRVIIEGIKAAPQVNAHVSYNKWLASGNTKMIDRIDINMPVLLPNNKMITVKVSDCGNKTLAELAGIITNLMDKVKNTNIDIGLREVALEDTIKKIKQGDIFGLLGRIAGLTLGKNKLRKTSRYERERYKNQPQEMRLCKDDLNLGTITISNMGAAVSGTNGFPALIDLISPQVMALGIGTLQEKPIVYDSQIAVRKIIPFCIVFDHRALDFGDVAPLIKRLDSVFKNPEIIQTW